MKVRYIKPTEPAVLTNGKVYPVLAIGDGYYRIQDDSYDESIPETTDGYLFGVNWFAIADFEPSVTVPSDEEYCIANGLYES